MLTAFLANAFVPEGNDDQGAGAEEDPVDIGEFKRLLEEQQRLTATLKATLARIEVSMPSEGGQD